MMGHKVVDDFYHKIDAQLNMNLFLKTIVVSLIQVINVFVLLMK